LKFTGNPDLLLPMLRRLRILFADDHEIFRAGLRQVFASDPQIEVIVEAADGEVALRAIISHKPDVAVLDFDLPRRNALEIAQELRGLRLETPVVILTAHRRETLFDAALAAGVRGYVLKDNAATDLLQCIRAVAQGDTYLSPTFSKYLLQRGQRAEVLWQQVRGLEALSPAERRVLRLVANGRATKEIAAELFLSPATVETHRKNICAKLQLNGQNKLLQFAIEHRAELL
jgi:DNA-binding NarL/FixJ family response regulator